MDKTVPKSPPKLGFQLSEARIEGGTIKKELTSGNRADPNIIFRIKEAIVDGIKHLSFILDSIKQIN